MNAAVAALRARLQATLGADAGRPAWGAPQAMTQVLDDVRRRHDGAAGAAVAADRIARAVAAFRQDGKVAGYVQLKHVCLGAAGAEADGGCLLAAPALRERLLALAEGVPGGRRQMKCFQCLLRSYWTFPADDAGAAPHAAREGRAALRAWLVRRHRELDRSVDPKPQWFALLGQHANLLSAQPCERYGPALLRGEAAELQAASDGLAIPGDSWVKQEAVLAQAQAALALDDDPWLEVLPQLLDIAAGKAGIAVSASLSRRCIALLLRRHARCEAVALHAGLLDAALAAIGNPWQRRASWDAYVLGADGKPCELAREMVNGWLKHLLIGGFFRLYGTDGAEMRRTDYWRRYDPFILSLWVGLSAGAIERRGDECEKFRRRAAGSLLLIDGLADDDNVLMMRVGDFLAVEFGGADRALHLFRWSGLDAKLTRRLGSARSMKYFNVGALMEARVEAILAHQDEQKTGLPWERRFDDCMRPRVWQGAGGGR
ncbi:MAG: EH signature domain-containing protein [Rhodocyclaceae bacterium]|nr:EH signature domain-containing protein [Rhodocyclaceae bacterium]